jgi:hypothetical protein
LNNGARYQAMGYPTADISLAVSQFLPDVDHAD